MFVSPRQHYTGRAEGLCLYGNIMQLQSTFCAECLWLLGNTLHLRHQMLSFVYLLYHQFEGICM